MNTEIKIPPSEHLLVLTQEMLIAAKAGDWEKLAELEKTRLPIFHHVFDQGITSNVDLAREVLSIDEETKKLAEAGIPDLKNELQKMKNSNQANKAYQAIQGLK